MDLTKKIKLNQFQFAGSIQKNLGEYIEVAITWHFDSYDGNVSEISEKEIFQDVMDIVDNAFNSEFEVAEMPNGREWRRSGLEQAVYAKINRMYK